MEQLNIAIKNLQPINYESFDVGYFVLSNGTDMGGSDYCKNCIGNAVKQERKFHIEQRQIILDKFNQIAETGFFKVGRKKINVKEKYSETEIANAKRLELKKYPAKVSFTYEGHDPDFGGGLHEPCTCDGCGEAFTCEFTANIDEAKYLLHTVTDNGKHLTDRHKWELEIALSNYEYADKNVKDILNKVINKLIKNKEKKKMPSSRKLHIKINQP